MAMYTIRQDFTVRITTYFHEITTINLKERHKLITFGDKEKLFQTLNCSNLRFTKVLPKKRCFSSGMIFEINFGRVFGISKSLISCRKLCVQTFDYRHHEGVLSNILSMRYGKSINAITKLKLF